MDFPLTIGFLSKCHAQNSGIDPEEARRNVQTIVDIALAMQLLPLARLEAMERDAHILHLAGEGLPRVTIALRMGMARSKVFEALRRHQRARREALRKAG